MTPPSYKKMYAYCVENSRYLPPHVDPYDNEVGFLVKCEGNKLLWCDYYTYDWYDINLLEKSLRVIIMAHIYNEVKYVRFMADLNKLLL